MTVDTTVVFSTLRSTILQKIHTTNTNLEHHRELRSLESTLSGQTSDRNSQKQLPVDKGTNESVFVGHTDI